MLIVGCAGFFFFRAFQRNWATVKAHDFRLAPAFLVASALALAGAMLLATFAVGVALGSGFASWLAHGRIILLPTPVAAIFMGIFALDVGLHSGGFAPGLLPLTVGQRRGYRCRTATAGCASVRGDSARSRSTSTCGRLARITLRQRLVVVR